LKRARSLKLKVIAVKSEVRFSYSYPTLSYQFARITDNHEPITRCPCGVAVCAGGSAGITSWEKAIIENTVAKQEEIFTARIIA
jgi:hypothetical protein